MATQDARGTKRTCQSGECGSRFYDLNRNPIVCPICGTIYEIAHLAPGAVLEAVEPSRIKGKRQVFEADAEAEAEPAQAQEGDELAAIETDEDLGDEQADETLIADEEEEGGSMGDIVGGRAEGEEEEP
jgi:uncharacterized protein (TIGR02300 family)